MIFREFPKIVEVTDGDDNPVEVTVLFVSKKLWKSEVEIFVVVGYDSDKKTYEVDINDCKIIEVEEYGRIKRTDTGRKNTGQTRSAGDKDS